MNTKANIRDEDTKISISTTAKALNKNTAANVANKDQKRRQTPTRGGCVGAASP